ncbi:hypothetical protein OSTOST_01684 [Ostertagia ostertagi]
MAHCNIGKNQCFLPHGTVIWNRAATDTTLPLHKSDKGIAYVTPHHIVLNNIQSAFTYKNVTFSPSKLSAWCLEKHAISMDNGVLIAPRGSRNYQSQTFLQLANRTFLGEQPTLKRSNSDTPVNTTSSKPLQGLSSIQNFFQSLDKKSMDMRRFKFGIRPCPRRQLEINPNNYKALSNRVQNPRPSILEVPEDALSKGKPIISAKIAHHVAVNSEPDFTAMNNDPDLSHEQRQDESSRRTQY